ncbi:hypothetical protein CRE_13642 [Caenorhabditis remanei]|uniref:Transposase Tc5 C-terminal domain-containing protein n=1 Tax=Caenorhabditis remanei TaxID=31234 RepID=E3N1F5_CAERE|nr:hypothetical protein CRE_13642 [Caenorhabditis remanei]
MDPPDFSEVRGKAIVESLAITFGLNLPSSVTLNDVEKRWRDRIALMIRCAETGEGIIREKDVLTRHDCEYDEEDLDWDYEDEVVEEKSKEITKQMMDAAIKFYRSCKKKINYRGQGTRSLKSMTRRFRWITSNRVLQSVITYGATGCYSDNTIHVFVGKSHIMSRATAEHFFKNVLFGGKVPATLLLILDLWPIFRDHAFIKSFAPPSTDLHIINIPPGGTSICQPADLSYNHQLKGIQKRLTSLVMFRDIRYRVSERDNLLKFASQAHWVIGSPRFKSFIAYGFYKGGFIHSKPPPFDGPKQFIFGAGISKPCSCSQEGFTVCPRCEESFCFECFWDKCHRC